MNKERSTRKSPARSPKTSCELFAIDCLGSIEDPRGLDGFISFCRCWYPTMPAFSLPWTVSANMFISWLAPNSDYVMAHLGGHNCVICQTELIDQSQYVKIQPKTRHLIMRLWGITTEFVGFIPQSLVPRSIPSTF